MGLRFDFVAISWILGLTLIGAWFFRKAIWVTPLILSFFFYCLCIIDNEIWNFFGRRLSWTVVKTFTEAQGRAGNMVAEYTPWILLGLSFSIPFMIWFYKILRQEKSWSARGLIFWFKQLGLILLLVLLGRGGFQKKPLSMIQAQHFESVPLNMLTLNSTFTLVKSFSKKAGLQKVRYFSSEKALSQSNSQLATLQWESPLKSQMPTNVVILILESFSWEYTALNPHLKMEYTPFLNSLMKRSLTFSNGLANGRRSIEGVAAILAGIPNLMEEPFISSEYAGLDVEGIAHQFHQRGYDTSFYHGGENGTMHFDSFAKKLGFQKYYGLNEYPDKQDFDGVWGIWDRPYLQYFAKNLSAAPTPFFSVLFTLSSHQPYAVPEVEKAQFPDQPEHPALKSLQYSDSALKGFFARIENEPWYQNTLFVLVADHTGPVIFLNHDNPLAAYKIPIVFFAPSLPRWPENLETSAIAQQADIPGTIYDLLNFKGVRATVFGRSLLRTGPRVFTTFNGGRYLHTDGTQVLTVTGEKTKASSFENWLFEESPSENLLESFRAHQQMYSEGLWNNQLYR